MMDDYRTFEDDLKNKPTDWIFGYYSLWNSLGIDLDDIVNNSGRALDFGCGAGRPASTLARYGFDVVGVDKNKSIIEKAKSRYNNAEFLAIDDVLPFDDNTFDYVMANWVFCTMGNPEEQYRNLNEIHRVLKDGGVFGLINNNPDNVGVRFNGFQNGVREKVYSLGDEIEVSLFSDGSDSPFIKVTDHYWTTEHYISLLERNGFTDISVKKDRMGEEHAKKIRMFAQGNLKFNSENEYAPFVIIGARAGRNYER